MITHMKKVLIFGASGFVGAYLIRELLRSGYQVAAADLQRSDGFPEGTAFYQVDLTDQSAVYHLMKDILPDAVINLAAISSVGQSWKLPGLTMQVNVTGAIHILEAARQLKEEDSAYYGEIPGPKVMFIGSSEEYEASDSPIDENCPRNANNPYGISKMTQERYAELYRERYGLRICYVHPFNHTGIGQKDSFVLPSFCKQAAEMDVSGKPGILKVGNLKAKRDFSDVRDIVRAYRMILEAPDICPAYNVGSGKAYSLEELLRYIISLAEVDILIQTDPERVRPIDTPVVCCDHGRITRELGWKPEIDIHDTLKEMFNDFRERKLRE